MNNIKGPAIFLAQFVGEEAPFNSLDNICKWASSLVTKVYKFQVGTVD